MVVSGDGPEPAAVATRFGESAPRFSQLIGGDLPDPDERKAFIAHIREALADLYLQGLQLPDVQPDESEWGPDEAAFTRWQTLHERLGTYLGNVNTYWEVLTLINDQPRSRLRWRMTWRTS